MKQNQYKELKETLHLTMQEIIVRWGHARFLLMLQTTADDRKALQQRLFHIHASPYGAEYARGFDWGGKTSRCSFDEAILSTSLSCIKNGTC
ncbi:hypothetical protein BsIDN1_35340 [Bacillus safensis]|uniref:Uncharacterized protein n=1 Tax=Bacillus safensis TaxID=561879 RepID=A0A5S9MED0_BACIA|nr:hypothetical protein BsIDN1_35340 [Bacillus safensis]